MNEASNTVVSKKEKWTATSWLLAIGIIFIALTLRSPLTAVGPVIQEIKESLHISNVLAGFITTIPLLAFAVVSPIVPKISRKYTVEKALMMATIILTVGILIRSTGSVSMLFLGTTLIGVGIAFGNVLLPSLIKLKFPLQVGLITACYTVAMNASASIAAGISYPVSTFAGWQGSLGLWMILAFIAVLIWIPQTKQPAPEKIKTSVNIPKKKPMWKYPLAWAVMLAMGLQSMLFYTTAAWVPEMFKAQGMSASVAGLMFSTMQLAQLPATFITPIVAGKLKDQRPIVLIFSVFYLLGFTGLIMGWTDLSILWMVLLGIAGGSSFSMCMMFFSLRSRDAFEAADLSGFAQSLGYLIAAIGSVLYGYIYDKYNSFDVANIMYLFVTVICIAASLIAAQNKFVTGNDPKL